MGKEKEEEKPVFVTGDTAIHKKGKLDPTDLEILKQTQTGEGLIKLTPETLKSLAEGLVATFDHYKEMAIKCMTDEQAEVVRKLRVDEHYSWRAVARACYDQSWVGWEQWNPPSSQPMGMALTERAEEILGVEVYNPTPEE